MTEELKPLRSIWELGILPGILILTNIFSCEDYGYLEPGQLPKSSTYPPEGKVINSD